MEKNNNSINLYCDESCHLEHDNIPVMVLGCIWLEKNKAKDISLSIRRLKLKYGLKWYQEIKWNKVSPKKLEFYLALVDLFFDNEFLNFRALIISDKHKLNHSNVNGQDHNIWYYKMYFNMIKQVLNKESNYNIYIDIKDTKGGRRVKKLHEVICNSFYDFNRSIINKIQLIKSEESEILQLADFFIGSLSYINRDLNSSEAKVRVIERIKEKSGYTLKKSTLLQEKKFNMFFWQPQEI